MRKQKNTKWLKISMITLFAFAAGMGCGENNDEEWRLPLLGGEGICGEGPATALGVCDWYDSLDGLVFGEILRSEFDESELYDAATGEKVEECSGTAHPRLEITLAVTESFVDSIEVGEEVQLYVGAWALYDWNIETFRSTPEEGMSWNEPEGLLVGREVGVGLHWYEPTDEWTTADEWFFALDSNSKTYFQGEDSCGSAYPAEVAGIGLSEWAPLFEDCDGRSAEGTLRREEIQEGWGEDDDPARTVGGFCDAAEDGGDEGDDGSGESGGSCMLDSDCTSPETCIAGICQVGE